MRKQQPTQEKNCQKKKDFQEEQIHKFTGKIASKGFKSRPQGIILYPCQ